MVMSMSLKKYWILILVTLQLMSNLHRCTLHVLLKIVDFKMVFRVMVDHTVEVLRTYGKCSGDLSLSVQERIYVQTGKK